MKSLSITQQLPAGKNRLLIIFLISISFSAKLYSQDTHPHILVNPHDKQVSLEKISKHAVSYHSRIAE